MMLVMKQSLAKRRLSGILEILILAGLFWSCWGCGGGSRPNQVMQPTQHSVNLSWTVNNPPVAGYNIYRGTQRLGPYPVKLNSSLNQGTSFTDSTVQNGVTYYYVVAAVDAQSPPQESGYSKEAQAVIPPS